MQITDNVLVGSFVRSLSKLSLLRFDDNEVDDNDDDGKYDTDDGNNLDCENMLM